MLNVCIYIKVSMANKLWSEQSDNDLLMERPIIQQLVSPHKWMSQKFLTGAGALGDPERAAGLQSVLDS